MGKQARINLEFPLAGLDRKFAYEKQPPFSTVDAENVRPDGTIKSRARGGSRPGLDEMYQEELGSGAKVRGIYGVTTVTNDGRTHWSDVFDGGSMGSQWTAASWVAGGLPSVLPENSGSLSYTTTVGAVRSLIDYKTASEYTIEIFIAPWADTHYGTYQIYGRMNDATPVATTDGFVASITHTGTGGVYTGDIKVYNGGVLSNTYAFAGGTDGYAAPGWFKVSVNVDTVKCYWRGTEEDSQDISGDLGAGAGHRVGFGMDCTVAGGVCLVEQFRSQYYQNNTVQPEEYKKFLIATAGGEVWRDGWIDKLEQISSSLTLSSSNRVNGAQYFQKLYVADSDLRAKGSDGVISGATLDPATFADWTIAGLGPIEPASDVVYLEKTGETTQVSTIASVAAGAITLSAAPTMGDQVGVTFRIMRGLKIIDPVADTITLMSATSGVLPVGCTLVAQWRDRLVWAGDPFNPNLWYMSAQGTETDYNYGLDPATVTMAVGGSDPDAGQVGDVITALVPHSEHYLFFGCNNEIYAMYGDPADGGIMKNVSHTIGIIAQGAWCHGGDDEIYFLSRDGLYAMPPVPDFSPRPLSRDKLPLELIDVDTALYDVSMEYDARARGVHIFITSIVTGGASYHWWYDVTDGGFWKQTYGGDYEPTFAYRHMTDVIRQSAVMIGGRDGYIRAFSDHASRDSGTAYDTSVTYGPIKIGGNQFDQGKVMELTGSLADQSGDVTMGVYVAESNEALRGADEFGNFTLSEGLNYKYRPQCAGSSMMIKLTGDAGAKWAVEQVTATIENAGEERKA